MSESTNIDSLLHEERQFPPSADFVTNAVGKPDLYTRASKDRLGFWADQARELLHWHTPFTQTLDWSGAPVARWFGDCRIFRPRHASHQDIHPTAHLF